MNRTIPDELPEEVLVRGVKIRLGELGWFKDTHTRVNGIVTCWVHLHPSKGDTTLCGLIWHWSQFQDVRHWMEQQIDSDNRRIGRQLHLRNPNPKWARSFIGTTSNPWWWTLEQNLCWVCCGL